MRDLKLTNIWTPVWVRVACGLFIVLAGSVATPALRSLWGEEPAAEARVYKDGEKYDRYYAPPAANETVIPLDAVAARLPVRLRRPQSLAVTSDGRTLLVACRESGSIVMIDTATQQVLGEEKLGERLMQIVRLASRDAFAVVDHEAHELLHVSLQRSDDAVPTIKVVERIALPAYPIRVASWPDGKQLAVTSLWSRKLSLVDTSGESWKISSSRKLDFQPREVMYLGNADRLIVADAFGGKLAVIDPSAEVETITRQFPGHNIRGLAVTPDFKSILVSHQMLNELAHTIRNDVHWGLLMSNDLRWLKTDAVLEGGKEQYFGSHMHPLGDAGAGAADPEAVVVSSQGTVLVALGGVGQISIGKEDDFVLDRLTIGRRPVAIALSKDEKTAYVANQFDDSIAVVNIEEKKLVKTIGVGPLPNLTVAERGEILFHDARMSHDSWMSCQSCHTDGHANGQLNDNFSDKSFGAPKRVLSLLGQSDTAPYAWNGKVADLATQVENSVTKTMSREDPPARDEVEAIAAYIATLKSPQPLAAIDDSIDRASIARGEKIFSSRNCNDCHAAPTYTSPETYDVGLVDELGEKRFNPPSLRGVSHRSPLLHNKRARTIEEVFEQVKHPNSAEYSADEVRDLAAFLRSL
ncbi:Cytochrome c peroxidase-like protein [Pirellula staleyi DSM 6068]|uniref:Cytochrome c peroxidase-like protein n=1 Tax=Pirellula staleyi (strain ATCC 27377 / DSM 6068 / ICPB 4128) TaxID=530564 RepID=D2R0I7_PIRSD|nr:cytochrome c peroxidase [Pirellula staleyi]ADB14855.1 Cytochrome c peroxidase-like protein [Pirellula staleyi DSM 6068]